MTTRPSPRTDADTTRPQPSFRGGVLVMAGLALTVLAMTVFSDDESSSTPSTPPSARTSTSAPPAGQPAHHPARKHLPRSKPVRLLIPKIFVDAPFTELAIGRSGQLNPPPADDTNLVGWFAKGPTPGEAGTAVVAGHVDTATAPAVFANLADLKKGDVFHVKRADKRRASFVVDSVETFAKDDFPDKRVYADTPEAQIRLITCAGNYDRAVKDYTDNLVVFAHLK
ncbi:class F sortase [Streptomyces sp. P17]|uniref:class F sortase n=1 Tax=Streptomyces sp. P17 TaxID=3074716 RepID=UPI0028F4016B|nr:class F sortase [Streptomyces sp. P17]MDT9695323.1 class F sortase [Streptomyces sp. P17]